MTGPIVLVVIGVSRGMTKVPIGLGDLDGIANGIVLGLLGRQIVA